MNDSIFAKRLLVTVGEHKIRLRLADNGAKMTGEVNDRIVMCESCESRLEVMRPMGDIILVTREVEN